MENHILLKHIAPDDDNMFACDECAFKCKKRETLGEHYQEKHKDNTQIASTMENTVDDIAKVKEELRTLKNNFERLELLYHDSLIVQ